jgi:hypothetical protein
VAVPRDKRHSLLLHIPKSWPAVLDVAAKAKGMTRAAYLRWAIGVGVEQTSGMGHVRLPPDDLGAIRKRSKKAERRAMRARHMARYRAKQRAKHLPQQTAIVFTFDDASGVVRASDLDALGSCVGVVDAGGRFQPESTRHPIARWLPALREAVDAGRLKAGRWELLLHRQQARE